MVDFSKLQPPGTTDVYRYKCDRCGHEADFTAEMTGDLAVHTEYVGYEGGARKCNGRLVEMSRIKIVNPGGKIRRIAILDTETTGLSPETDQCIEVAVCLYDLVAAAPLASFSSLIRAESNAAFEVNRIPVDVLKEATPADVVWRRVALFAESADVFLAHRADFDRGFTPEPLRSSRPWVCSKFHVEWPEGKSGDHLLHLALAHGVGVVHAHRAHSDVDTLSRLLTRVAERVNLQELFALAMRPRKRYVSLAPYEQKDVVKAHGFSWLPERKAWEREMVPEDVGKLPFKVREA